MIQCDGQLSLFDALSESHEDIVEQYLKEAIQSGSGFSGGKQRIANLYDDNLTAVERAKRIKDEYGKGGASYCTKDGCGLSWYDTFDGKGFKIVWEDNGKENNKIFSWSHIEKAIGKLISTGEY